MVHTRTTWYFPKIRGPQYRPQYIIVLIIGTPKKVPLILGNPHIQPCTKHDLGRHRVRNFEFEVLLAGLFSPLSSSGMHDHAFPVAGEPVIHTQRAISLCQKLKRKET